MADHSTSTDAAMTVRQLAKLAGVSVRTLHHYDRIGLLVPAARSESDYRLYDEGDLARLREILVWRRLDLSLAQIGRLLDDSPTDRRAVLERQRRLVGRRIEELRDVAAAIDRAIEDEGAGTMARDEAIIEALDGFDPADHEDEARDRWGDTDAYRESARRASHYSPEDWKAIRAEAEAITERIATLWRSGAPATGDEAIAMAQLWREHVDRWFYECPPSMLRGLGDMYVADPRFTASWEGADGQRAGLATWVRDAWHARADRG